MKFLAPEFLALLLGVFLILAFYVFIRRRMIVRTGFYNLWLEAAQELGYIRKLRLRKILSILLASVIFSLLVFALAQPQPSEKPAEMPETQTFIVVDTFYETFPYFDRCVTLQKILQKYADQDTKGKVYFQDADGIHIRTFEESARIDWSQHLMFIQPKLSEILENIAARASSDDEILIITFNNTLLASTLTELEPSIQKRIKYLKIPETVENKAMKTDVSIESIHQQPDFPLSPEKFTVKLRNYSSNRESVQLILYPGSKVLKEFQLEPFKTSEIELSVQELYSNSENTPEISFKGVIDEKNPLYFMNLEHKYSTKSGIPMLLEVRTQAETTDVRPANNFAFLSLNPVKTPKVAVIGEDADSEYVSMLFGIFEELKMLKLVKLADDPEIVIQLGKTALPLPENAHLIKFEPGITEYDAPSAYFWKKTTLIDAEPLQKFFFSLQKVSYQIPDASDVLLDSPGGILAKISENQGRYIIHFSFSINPSNSDFLLRPEIAPAIFSRILNALTRDKLEIKHLPTYFTDDKFDVSTNQYLTKLDFTDFERIFESTFIDIDKNKVVSLLNPEKPGIFALHAGENAEFVAINPVRSDINMIENANLMNLQAPKPKNLEEKKENEDEKAKYIILLIQIALLLVITEAVLYRLKITE